MSTRDEERSHEGEALALDRFIAKERKNSTSNDRRVSDDAKQSLDIHLNSALDLEKLAPKEKLSMLNQPIPPVTPPRKLVEPRQLQPAFMYQEHVKGSIEPQTVDSPTKFYRINSPEGPMSPVRTLVKSAPQPQFYAVKSPKAALGYTQMSLLRGSYAGVKKSSGRKRVGKMVDQRGDVHFSTASDIERAQEKFGNIKPKESK